MSDSREEDVSNKCDELATRAMRQVLMAQYLMSLAAHDLATIQKAFGTKSLKMVEKAAGAINTSAIRLSIETDMLKLGLDPALSKLSELEPLGCTEDIIGHAETLSTEACYRFLCTGELI